MAYGLVTHEQVLACVADQRRLAAEGRAYTLAQVLLGRKLISPDAHRQVLERLGRRASSGDGAPGSGSPSSQLTAPPRTAAPEGFGSGRRPPSDDELEAAARSWEDASSAAGDAYEVVSDAAAPRPQVVLPGQKPRKDAGIRKLLGVSADAAEFDFGPYRVLGEVAAGGMGVIYRARAGDTGRVYALKALINVEQAKEKQLRRFIQEAQSAMRLDHPGIVKIHDIGVLETIPYFTMDLVEGDDLQAHLKRKSLDRPELLRIVAQVCRAVHYAHEHAVIHRDLKPANIIIRDADRQPILTDFGLAKNLDSTFKLTAEGAMVGTPLFLSPEQVSGQGHKVDRRCDVYGLGVMLYQVLTGKLPFMGRNPYEVYKKILHDDPEPPSRLDPEISPELESICLMALAKDREERFPTAEAMAEDLERAVRGEPTQAVRPPSVSASQAAPGRGARPAPRAAGGDEVPLWILVGIGLLACLIVVGVAVIVWLLTGG